MTSTPILSPVIPFLGPIGGNMQPGRMVRIQGSVPIHANRFIINLVCGPSHGEDIALHISVRMHENYVVRNTFQHLNWGPEETFGHMPFHKGQGFEILILCDPAHYKIAVNGQHFAEYPHRIPYQRVTHLQITNDVFINMIQFEGGFGNLPYGSTPGAIISPPASGPYPTTPGLAPYPSQPGRVSPVPAYGMQPAAVPYPAGVPGYPPAPPGYPPAPPGYPPPPPGYQQHSPSHYKNGGILDKAGAAVAGILGATGLRGMGSHHGGHHGGHHGPGMMGTALGAGVVGAAMTGHMSPKKALKLQKKQHKKALKYGLPIAAGAGLGAYALHKGLKHHHHHGHHHGHSSSSSSSSSSEEE